MSQITEVPVAVATQPERPFVVGIGSSAGGLESLQALLPGLPADHGLCYVVLQHTAPKYRSMLAEILSKHTRMPVRELRDGDPLCPNEILVTPPNANAEFDGRQFRLSEPAPHMVPKPSVNLFLVSLATHCGPRSVGVILSGTGSDGALGMRQLKAAGGHLLVQLPESAKYTGMPDAAIRTAPPDFVLAPEKMGAVIGELVLRTVPDTLATQTADADRLRELLQRLKRRCGIDFADYKEGTLTRRIGRRMLACNTPGLADYLALVEQQPEELDALLRDTLISVTAFFRDPQIFAPLAAAFEQLVAAKSDHEPLRLWVTGCATGEEVYSILIALQDRLGDHFNQRRLQVFATDVDLEALAIARHAVYPVAAVDALPPELVQRHFIVNGGQCEVPRRLREMVVFSRHDLTRDPPFPRLDLISCRNVLIYLKQAAQGRVMNAFRYALRPDGLLLLGQSESVHDGDQGFSLVDRDAHLYQRSDQLPAATVRRIDMPSYSPAESLLTRRNQGPDHEVQLLRQGAQLYLPPCVLVDEQLRILQVHGDVSAFFAIQPGEQSMDLLLMARPDIQAELRILCAGAGNDPELRHAHVTTSSGRVRQRQRWRVVLHSFVGNKGVRHHLIAFERITRTARQEAERGVDAAKLHDAELASVRERMRNLIEQLESSNEEMQALNEEAHAANEELQASNEELEAANEELQAANQELVTVNAELSHQWQLHRQLSEELESVQNSVDLPLLVIDESCTLRRFNEAAARLFHLRDSSLGLSLATIRHPDGMPDLMAHVQQAQRSASPLVVVLPPTGDGHEYVLHLTHNVIGGQRHGLVITLIDNTDLARAQRSNRQLEHRLLSVLTTGPTLVAIKDLTGRYEFVNAPYARFLGVEDEALIGRTDAQALPPELARSLRRCDLEALGSNGTTEHEQALRIGEVTRSWLTWRFPLLDEQGHTIALCLQATDISRLRQADEQLRIAEKILACTTEGVMITDPDLNILRVNDAFCRISGYSREQALGRRPSMLSSGRHDPAFYQAMWAQINTAGQWQGEIWNHRADGQAYLEWLSINTLRDDDGRLTHYVGVFSDISSIAEARARMEAMATHDALTGLPNRNLLEDRLSHAIEAAQRSNRELAVCFIDLDNFKTINDSLGHQIGDEVLRLVTRRITDNVRTSDTLARLGGDEFVLLLENTSRHECLTSIERISSTLAEPCQLGPHLLGAAASIGIAIFPDDGRDAATLMRNADAAMYRSKEAGRGRYEFYAQEVGETARNRLAVESGLREALRNGELHLDYQPQFDLRTLEVVGVEALLRWVPARGAEIPPAMFLPIAEESSLIEQIGDWVLDRACAQLADWRARGIGDFTLSINLAPRQLRDSRCVDTLRRQLIQHRVPAERLVLELTESALGQDLDTISGLLRQMQALGCRISLDDFGTGYSSLARLRQLPLHELKIDRSFIQNVAQIRNDRRIVHAMIELGAALDMRVVIEGIETIEQLELLRQSRPGLVGQGFVFARPMNAAMLEAWLQNRRQSAGDALQASEPFLDD